MGRYATAQISVNVNCAFRAAAEYGLPTPRPNDDWACYFTASDVKKWLEFRDEMKCRLSFDAIRIMLVMEADACSYIYKATNAAPAEPKARRAYLRRKSRAYRLYFA